MNLQIIKSIDGKAEYVLLPMNIYNLLQHEIKKQFQKKNINSNYISFNPADYVENPIALARIKAGLTQEQLAKRMKVTQAYVSKIESQEKVTFKLLNKVKMALKK